MPPDPDTLPDVLLFSETSDHTPDADVRRFKDHVPPPKFIRADDTLSPEDRILPFLPANGETFTLDELQAAVGGLIELVYLGDDLVMVIDEDGKAKGLPTNESATWLAQPGLYIFPEDVIVGDAVVCPEHMVA